MHTIVLRSNPRRGHSGATFTIDVLGQGPIKDAVQQSIRELEHHPAKAARRCLIDMLSTIEKHSFQIQYTEHTTTDDDMGAWPFVLQG